MYWSPRQPSALFDNRIFRTAEPCRFTALGKTGRPGSVKFQNEPTISPFLRLNGENMMANGAADFAAGFETR
jgi:hypothetical protein